MQAKTFNIGSPQQLGKVLFGKLGIPGSKKTKTGWATGVEVLQALAREYPICALVLEWREVTKLKNTYVDVIPQLVDPRDGRLRTEFNQTATATGRLSSTNPNLQNIPVRGELGRRIRRAFVARSDEYVLLAADYSQIELRLMAHLSGDRALRTAFEEGQDIHDFTARQIFGIAPSLRVDPNQRRMAKSVNFGLFYGMSDFGLAQRLEISRAEAKEITTAYFARFPDVRAYIDRTIDEGRRNGYVSTILGRRRYMPGLVSGQLHAASGGRARGDERTAPRQRSGPHEAGDGADRPRARSGASSTRPCCCRFTTSSSSRCARAELSEVANLVRGHMENAHCLVGSARSDAQVGTQLVRRRADRRGEPRACIGLIVALVAFALPTVVVHAPRAELTLEVASTEAQRERGLMDRTAIPPHTGMIFVFERDEPVEFWMKETLVPFDMIFVAADGTVRRVFANVPVVAPTMPDESIPREGGEAKYVIELRAGEASQDGIAQGIKLDLHDVPSPD